MCVFGGFDCDDCVYVSLNGDSGYIGTCACVFKLVYTVSVCSVPSVCLFCTFCLCLLGSRGNYPGGREIDDRLVIEAIAR